MTAADAKRIERRRSTAESLATDIRASHERQSRAAWQATPISMARLASELWAQIEDREWSLVSHPIFQSFWPVKLWNFTKHSQYIGSSGGAGIGYGAPAAVGAALAFKGTDVLPVNIQSDGDLLYGPLAFWTAAHHNVPLLSIMHNNGGYHQEFMHLQKMASRRRRGISSTAKIGNAFIDPPIDYAAMAGSMGVWSSGPINDPADFGPALKKAIEVVDSGEPALIDVICQPR